jgi:hypothetical protein
VYTVKFDKTRSCFRYVVLNNNEPYMCCTTKRVANHVADVMNKDEQKQSVMGKREEL